MSIRKVRSDFCYDRLALIMGGIPKKFTIERAVSSEQSVLEKHIDGIYAKAREHINPDAFDALYANVSTFCDILLKTFSREELMQVRAYHRLIRSGIPSSGMPKLAEKEVISDDRKKQIEEALEAFVKEQAEVLDSPHY